MSKRVVSEQGGRTSPEQAGLQAGVQAAAAAAAAENVLVQNDGDARLVDDLSRLLDMPRDLSTMVIEMASSVQQRVITPRAPFDQLTPAEQTEEPGHVYVLHSIAHGLRRAGNLVEAVEFLTRAYKDMFAWLGEWVTGTAGQQALNIEPPGCEQGVAIVLAARLDTNSRSLCMPWVASTSPTHTPVAFFANDDHMQARERAWNSMLEKLKIPETNAKRTRFTRLVRRAGWILVNRGGMSDYPTLQMRVDIHVPQEMLAPSGLEFVPSADCPSCWREIYPPSPHMVASPLYALLLQLAYEAVSTDEMQRQTARGLCLILSAMMIVYEPRVARIAAAWLVFMASFNIVRTRRHGFLRDKQTEPAVSAYHWVQAIEACGFLTEEERRAAVQMYKAQSNSMPVLRGQAHAVYAADMEHMLNDSAA